MPPKASSLPDAPSDLRQIRLLRHATDHDLNRLWPLVRPRHMRARATISIPQQMPGTVTFAWSGAYRMAVFSPRGVGVTLELIRPGDGFGYTACVLGRDFGESLRLTADQGGALLCLPAPEFLRIVTESPKLMRALLNTMAELIADSGSRIYELSALDVRARLVAELMRLVDHQSGTNGSLSLDPAPTHAALAAQIGATRENVTRHLKDLARKGVIRLGRRVLEVTDMERLRSLDRETTGRGALHPNTWSGGADT